MSKEVFELCFVIVFCIWVFIYILGLLDKEGLINKKSTPIEKYKYFPDPKKVLKEIRVSSWLETRISPELVTIKREGDLGFIEIPKSFLPYIESEAYKVYQDAIDDIKEVINTYAQIMEHEYFKEFLEEIKEERRMWNQELGKPYKFDFSGGLKSNNVDTEMGKGVIKGIHQGMNIKNATPIFLGFNIEGDSNPVYCFKYNDIVENT